MTYHLQCPKCGGAAVTMLSPKLRGRLVCAASSCLAERVELLEVGSSGGIVCDACGASGPGEEIKPRESIAHYVEEKKTGSIRRCGLWKTVKVAAPVLVLALAVALSGCGRDCGEPGCEPAIHDKALEELCAEVCPGAQRKVTSEAAGLSCNCLCTTTRLPEWFSVPIDESLAGNVQTQALVWKVFCPGAP